MQTLKAFSKSVVFGVLLFSGFVGWVIGLPFVTSSPQLRWRWRCFAFRQWARLTALLLGMRLNAGGKIRREPFMLLANHLSYLDVILLALHCDAVFVAKSEIAHWPVIGLLSRCMDTVFIERGRKRDILRVNALIENHLRAGRSVVVFPEGTTSAGASVLPFKSSLLQPAVQLDVPVITASLHYTTRHDAPPASAAVCWWGETSFVPHLWRLFQLAGFMATVRFNDALPPSRDRKQLARMAHFQVAENLQRIKRESALPHSSTTAILLTPMLEEL